MLIFFINMETGKTLELLEFVQTLRNWGKENFPVADSIIGSNLIIFLAIEFFKENPLTVKQLFASFPYSYTATRQHYNNLLNDGWIWHQSNENDARVKYIRPSDKFLNLTNNYAKEIEKALASINFLNAQNSSINS